MGLKGGRDIAAGSRCLSAIIEYGERENDTSEGEMLLVIAVDASPGGGKLSPSPDEHLHI